ncbi:LexA family transcriptional regulator [Bacillus pacificus]|uniref:LexA family transcriptional regulator n=1 Tax=Bacillus pacificus TaxID=2026187 RepID=UPI003D6612F8
MNYYEKLNQMIEKSNLTLKEIAEKCMLYGVSINPSYISKLRTGKQPPASDDVNIAIAKACGFEKKIEDFLFEAYLEKSPEYIKNLLLEITDFFSNTAQVILETQVPPHLLPLVKAQFDQMTRYDIVKQTLNNAGTVNKVNIQPSKSIKMTDDSMEPLIPKGATLHFEEIDEIKNGDVIVTMYDETYVVRKVVLVENKTVLIALKKEIQPIIINDINSQFLGKVTSVIHTID